MSGPSSINEKLIPMAPLVPTPPPPLPPQAVVGNSVLQSALETSAKKAKRGRSQRPLGEDEVFATDLSPGGGSASEAGQGTAIQVSDSVAPSSGEAATKVDAQKLRVAKIMTDHTKLSQKKRRLRPSGNQRG